MTREEAIKILNRDDDNMRKGYFCINDFLAIEVLKSEKPSEDCVSRQSIDQNIYEYAESNGLSYANMKNYILGTPPVTPTQKWIPVSKKLPEEDGDYLLFGKVVEDEENNIFIGEYDSCGEQFGIWQEQFDRTTLGCLGSEFYEYASVLAWLPLPEPYKAEMVGAENE